MCKQGDSVTLPCRAAGKCACSGGPVSSPGEPAGNATVPGVGGLTMICASAAIAPEGIPGVFSSPSFGGHIPCDDRAWPSLDSLPSFRTVARWLILVPVLVLLALPLPIYWAMSWAFFPEEFSWWDNPLSHLWREIRG